MFDERLRASPPVAARLMTALLLAAGGAVANVPADGTLKDPTRPLEASQPAVEAAPAAERPTLDSVLIAPSRRVAVIDGRTMSEGDERDGVQVLEIRRDAVVVRVNGTEKLTLELARRGMKKEMP